MSSTQLLLLGEGDFSFTHSLSNSPTGISFLSLPYTSIIATSLDSKQEVIQKYPSFLDKKFPASVQIFHNVNALDLSTWPPQVLHNATILWNHPHCGRENAKEHFQLLAHFFHTISSRDCGVIISLIQGQYERWKVEEAANKFGFYLQKSPIEFNPSSDFPGYEARRNLSGTSFKSSPTPNQTGKSFFYIFKKHFVPGVNNVMVDDLADPSVSLPEYKCSLCEMEKTFKTQQGLKTHIRQVHELLKYTDRQTEYVCKICYLKFNGKEALDNHSYNVHEFKKLFLENKHMVEKRDRDGTESSYCCEICGSCDPDHVLRFGTNEELEECRECGITFRDKRALLQHTSRIHSR